MSNATQAAPALPLMDETYYRSRRRRQGLREDLNSFWFLLPILALFVILFLVPLVQTAYYSFTDFNGYSTNMKFVGFDNYKKVFSDPSTLSGLGFTILYAIVVMIGWHATLYLAFLQAIPADLYEQATVDGASKFQQFIHITLPQLTPGIVTSTFLLMSGGLKVYDLPYTMTKGGPGYSTYTVTQSIIQQGIGQSQYGIGSALAVLFFIATGIVVFLQMSVSNLISRRFQ